ncbi:MAG TPA: hypothetical protein VMR33_07465 [Candidatus Baltobacteraceae bacterium]|jgi:hypothetical protein|nr:hypothetical protein [Candidatus Baltobacteraceae bacterium]
MKWKTLLCCASLLWLIAPLQLRADSTWVYAVQITAALQTNPPSITLNWIPDMYGMGAGGYNSYTIYRKSEDATNWGDPLAEFDGTVTNFTDTHVLVGVTYEYQIAKYVSVPSLDLTYNGFGYIYSGIEAPLIEDRGTLELIIATNSTIGLSNELEQLKSDLVGDGWDLICHDVSSNDSPVSVRSLITNDYWADPEEMQAVFLFGHVPILMSGYLNYDGHYTRAMPADTYYGEMNDDWTVPENPTNGPSYIPSDVALEVGRVDMFDMIGVGSVEGPWPSEQELLRNYLNKDHKWRTHQIQVQRQSLMGDRRGDVDGTLAMAASGYRNFTPFFGASNPLYGTNDIIEANIQDDAPIPQRWIAMLDTTNYLWAFGDGGGELNGCTYLGTNGEYNEVLSTDIVGTDAKAVFVMLFGSYMGNWNGQDDLLRSVLATPTMGLACMMVGEPHWFVHHMGLGETIGYGTRLTVNNLMLYQSASNAFQRAVYINLMGDPTLRQDPFTPPTNFSATVEGGGIALNWQPGADSVLGYNIYISAHACGPFLRLNSSLITGTNDTDVETPGTYWYMVRGIRVETNPSGSYTNASEGVFASATLISQAPPITVGITQQLGTFALNWNTLAGLTYRVLASSSLNPPYWMDVSGTITATNTNTAWSRPAGGGSPQYYFEIASP